MTETAKGKKWVFVVEDDTYLNKAYSAKFAHENIEAQFATDGDQVMKALAEVGNAPPAVMLLDLMLPHASGFEILKLMKSNKTLKDIPVIILTNLAQEADAKKGLELGAEEYLVKADTKIADIVAKIKKHL